MRSTALRRLGVTLAVGTLALATGCGGGEEDSGSSGEGSGETSITVTQADIEEYLTPPEDLPVDTPLSQPAPTGIRVTFVGLPFSQSVSLLKGLEDAAEVLDWTVENLTFDPANPATLGTTLDTALSQQPDAILITGALTEQFASFIPEAQAAGVPLIPTYTPEDAQDGVYPVLKPVAQYEFLAGMLVDALAADAAEAGVTPHVVELTNPEVAPILGSIQVAVRERLSEVCPDCTHDVLDIPLADLFNGQNVQSIVSYLQSHPDVNYIIPESGQNGVGLEAALASAGLTDVKIFGNSATDVQIEALANGAEGAWTVESFEVGGWIMADQVARAVVADPTDVWDEYELGYLLTSENAGDIENPADPLFPADYREEFTALWGR